MRFAVASGDPQELATAWKSGRRSTCGGVSAYAFGRAITGQETVFGDDPAAMARHWVDLGAKCLHLVDLDGAREGRPVNLASIRSIVEAVDVPCELGGGIRNEESIRTLLELGLRRLVIGTLALRSPTGSAEMCRKYPEPVGVGDRLPRRPGGHRGLAGHQRRGGGGVGRRFAGEPIAALVYTDIAANG